MPIHFFLRDKLRHAVLDRFRRAGGQRGIHFRFQIDDMEFAATDGSDRTSIG